MSTTENQAEQCEPRATADGRTLTPPQAAALAAIEERLRWPSLHWGVEHVHSDAWPHLASAAADAALAKPTPMEFIALVGQERMTHEARGYGAEHDEREGIGHLLHWAMEYASKGEHVKAMSLVMAAMDVESKRAPRTVNTVEELEAMDTMDVLIASGRYRFGGEGTFHNCHVRRVPDYVTGGGDVLFEVLVHGASVPENLVRAEDIRLPATVLRGGGA